MSEKNNNTSDNVEKLRTAAKEEPIASFLGMKLIELTHGYAKVSMQLKPEYLNFNGIIYGGIVMAIADYSFAYANNTILCPNLASQFNIHFIAKADVGDELIAECRVLRSGKRVCISEMTVVNQNNRFIAKASGTTIPILNDR
jgi:acyl-CoA thioesterase